ncbi:Myotubularin- protein 1, partial [Bonamia ostreae]
QLSALAQMMLDPFYRTLKGFLILITKEFLSFGHMFGVRNGNASKENANGRSPIFLQFLDATYQLCNQYQFCFEFNSILLEKIAEESFYCKYGTFLYNNEKERKEKKLRYKTVSLWTYILRNPKDYTNVAFTPLKDVILPPKTLRHIVVWPFYYRQHIDSDYRIPLSFVMSLKYESDFLALNNKIKILEKEVDLIKSKNSNLKKQMKTSSAKPNEENALEENFKEITQMLHQKDIPKQNRSESFLRMKNFFESIKHDLKENYTFKSSKGTETKNLEETDYKNLTEKEKAVENHMIGMVKEITNEPDATAKKTFELTLDQIKNGKPSLEDAKVLGKDDNFYDKIQGLKLKHTHTEKSVHEKMREVHRVIKQSKDLKLRHVLPPLHHPPSMV